MIPILDLNIRGEKSRVEGLLSALALDPVALALGKGERARQVVAVLKILEDVAQRGDAALVDSSREFDDPDFSVSQIRVTQGKWRRL